MNSPKKESDNPTSSVNDDQIRRAQLQMQFHGTRREDFQAIEAYVEKLKSISNSLAEMDSQISDSDMVLQFLAGLPTQYSPLIKTILSRCPLPNFDEACSILYMQEDILSQVSKRRSKGLIINDDQIRRSQLQRQFDGTRREDFQTVEAYVEKLKSVANSLAEMDSQISDSDMVLQLLTGLSTEYSPLVKTILARRPLPNFDQACSMLYMQEDILSKKQITSDSDVGDAERSYTFFTKDKFYAVMDTLGTVTTAAAALGTVCTVAGPLGTVVGTVGASRMVVVGAVGAISAMTGWKFGKQSAASNSSS